MVSDALKDLEAATTAKMTDIVLFYDNSSQVH
jgi:hypothetical protein